MKKLINGILEFRKNVLEDYKETFARLALNQTPDTLFIACSDSRVVPNLFASTNPGDLFVVRNIGNMIPPCEENETSVGAGSVAAALEFSLLNLGVSSIIVCGHSECGAIKALINGRENIEPVNLRNWLKFGDPLFDQPKTSLILDEHLSAVNKLTQSNIILQMEHLKTYPIVQQFLEEKKLTIHGWWFDITTADVYAFEEDFQKFILIDENEAERILTKLK